MKLNFTIELPCKDHENCYNLEVDGENQVMNYQVDGQPQINNGVTSVNLGQVTNLVQTSFNKITITEKFTRKVQKKLKVPLEKPLEEISEYEEYSDLLNKEYNELVYKHNEIVDINENIKKVNKDLKHELMIKHPDPKDSMEYKTLLQQYQSAQELQKIQLDRLEEKLKDKEDQNGFDQQLREQKFKELEQDNKDFQQKINSLQEQLDLLESQRQKLSDEKKEIEQALEDKYDHFEEMNKYINDLLLEKKDRLIKLENKERKIKELEFDLDSIIRYKTNEETKSGQQPNSLGENLIQKYKKTTTQSTNIYMQSTQQNQTQNQNNANGLVQNSPNYQNEQVQNFQSYQNNQNENIQNSPNYQNNRNEQVQQNNQSDKNLQSENQKLKLQIEQYQNFIKNLPQDEQQLFLKYKNNNEQKTTQHYYSKTVSIKDPKNQEQQENYQRKINELIDENEDLKHQIKTKDKFIKNLPQNFQNDYQDFSNNNQRIHTKETIIQNDSQLIRDLKDKHQLVEEQEDEIYKLKKQLKNKDDFIRRLPKEYQDQFLQFNKDNEEAEKEEKEKESGNQKKYKNIFIEDLAGENERLQQENQKYKDFIDNLPPNQRQSFEEQQNQQPKDDKRKSIYSNDPQLLILFEEKKQQLEKMEMEIEDLKEQLKNQQANINITHKPEVIRNENKTTKETIIKADPKVKEKLDEALQYIRKLEDQNEEMRNMLQAKQSEVDELQQILETIQKQQQEQQSTQQNTKTKEVKHVYLQPKDRTKEWKQAHDTTQNLVKTLRDLISEISGEENTDNLDIEITQKNAQGFLMPILSYNKKGERYLKDLRALLEENKQDKEMIKDLKEQLKNFKQNIDIEEIKEIFYSTQNETDNMIDILKMAQKQPFVDFKKQNIESDQIDLYFNGITQNFHDCQEFYKKIRKELDEKNKELSRLKKFEKSVNSGLNKDVCYEDFKSILAKNIKLNKQLGEIAQKIFGDQEYNVIELKNSDPQNADDTLDQIYDSFNISNQTNRDIQRALDDLADENQELKKKLEDQSKNQINIDPSSLSSLVKKEFENQKKIKDILSNQDLQKSQSFQVNFVESNNPQDIIDQVNKINDLNMVDLNQLKSILEDKNQQIEKLKDYEKQAKSGQQQNVAVLNDLKYILNKNNKLYGVAYDTYNIIYKSGSAKKNFEAKENDQDDYINQISKCTKESQNLIDSVKDKLGQNQGELERLIQFEKQIVQGTNKDNCKSDFENLFFKSKKNVKNQWNILEKVKQLSHEKSALWESTVIQSPETENYLNGTIENLNKQERYNKEMDELIDTISKQNYELQKFKQDIDNGKNKNNCLEDFKNLYFENKSINDKAREALQKATNDFVKSHNSQDFYKENSPEYIQASQNLNQDTKKMLDQLKDELLKLQTENQKLKNFQNDVQSGKNKDGALRELKQIYNQNNNSIGILKEALKEAQIEDVEIPKRKEDESKLNADDLIESITDQNDYLRKYIKKLKDRIQDLHDQLQASLKQNKNSGNDLIEITAEKEQLQKKVMEIESQNIKLEQEIFQLNEIFEHSKENQILINKLLEIVSKGQITEKVNYSIDNKNREELFNTSTECLVFNKNKLETLAQLLKNYSSNDSMVMLNVLQQLENYKYSFREVYNQILDEDLEDTSGVIMSEAKDSDKILDFIYKNIKFLGQEIFTMQNEVTDKINVVIQAKNEILNEKNKLKLQNDDLQFEINKKTTLIGKLQVKIYMLISILDFQENHMNK